MNTVLVSNIAVYGLVIAALTVVPMLPGMIMKRVLSDGQTTRNVSVSLNLVPTFYMLGVTCTYKSTFFDSVMQYFCGFVSLWAQFLG